MTIRGRVSRHEAGFSEPRYEHLRQLSAVLGPRLTLMLTEVGQCPYAGRDVAVDDAFVRGRLRMAGGPSLARLLAERGVREESQDSHRNTD